MSRFSQWSIFALVWVMIYSLISLSGKYYFSGVFGSILMYAGAFMAALSVIQFLKVAKLRIQGNLFRARKPTEYIEVKKRYENVTGKEWQDPGRIYLFNHYIKRFSNGAINSQETDIKAAKRVHGLYPSYSINPDREDIS